MIELVFLDHPFGDGMFAFAEVSQDQQSLALMKPGEAQHRSAAGIYHFQLTASQTRQALSQLNQFTHLPKDTPGQGAGIQPL